MICNTPTKLQHSSWAATPWCGLKPHPQVGFSLTVFSPHCSRPFRASHAFQGVPEAEGEPEAVARSPQSVPIPTPLLGGEWVFWGGRSLLTSLCSGRLFRPHESRKCHRGGGGGGDQTSPAMALWTIPSPVIALAAGQPPAPVCPVCPGQSAPVCSACPAESRGKEQEGVPSSALQ